MPPSNHCQNRASDLSLSLVLCVIREKRRQIARNVLLALLFAMVSMFFLPRRYHSNMQMVIEEHSYVASGIKTASVMLGVNIGDPAGMYDAFLPITYPEFLQDNRLLGHLIFSEVTTADGRTMSYGAYLRKHHTPLSVADKDLRRPSETLDSLMKAVRKQLRVRYNSKKGVLIMDASADDPSVCRQVCQSMGDYLLHFITSYRVKKQRAEVEHFAKVEVQQKRQLEKAQKALAEFNDSHWGTVLPSEEKRKNQLADEVVALRRLYESVKVEYQMSRARLQDITPAFVVYNRPAIPCEKTGVGRIFFCCCLMFLSFLYSIIFYMRRELWAQIVR